MFRLCPKDMILLGAIVAAVAIVGFAAQSVAPASAWIVTVAAACGATLFVVLDAYRRLQMQLKEAAREQHAYQRDTYHQTEALLSVINTVKPSFPLPATRTWSASPDILNQLCRLVLSRRPSVVFEAGSGISTVIVAHCLRRLGQGRVVSLEHDPGFAAATRQLLADHDLSDIATIVDAPLKEI